jgi:hypothetical protein
MGNSAHSFSELTVPGRAEAKKKVKIGGSSEVIST